MQRWRTLVSSAVVIALAGAVAHAQVLPRDVRARILEAVVEIAPYDDDAGRFAGTGGSGTIISSDGYVLTNFHVIGDDVAGTNYTWHAIFVTDPANPDRATEHRYWARFVAGDAAHDLAILRIELMADESPLPPGTAFTSMAIGDSNALLPGDPITVVGYPGIGGFTVTVTTGIVSGWLGEDLESGGKQWIKTDARIAGGNSGGGAFDEAGLLVAVPTSRLQSNEGAFEEQNLLRPVALAMALITAHVPNAVRAGGISTMASLPGGPASPPSSTPQARPAPGEPIRGTLGPGDETLDSGEYLQVHEHAMTAGVPVEVTLRSTEFDPYLAVIDPAGEIVLEVDDSLGEGLDVRETFVPDTTGTYLLVVTSAFPSETGRYELRVLAGARAPDASAASPLAPFAPPPQADPFPGQPGLPAHTAARALDPATGTVGSIPIGGRVEGRLAGSDEVTYHTYVVEVPPGTREVAFVMRADADLDLFVKYGSDIMDWGQDGDWDQRDIELDAFATLVVPSPRAGAWYVDVVFFQGAPATASYSFEVR